MSTRLITLAGLAVAGVMLASAAAAGPVTTRQRVAIIAKGGIHGFVLRPLKPGVLGSDSGTASDCCWTERIVRRDGQKIEIDNPLATWVGKHGKLVIRFRIEWVDAGNGYGVGTGTWKVVRGTGAYRGVRGGGRSAHAWLPRGPVSWRADGFLGLRSKTASSGTRAAAPAVTLDPEKAALQHYLSAMSWPVRASLGRAKALTTAIDGFINAGDPPFLGQIARGCRNFRAVEARGRLLRITPPTRLNANHRRLVSAYSKLRAGCRGARRTTLALAAAIERFYTTHSPADKAALQRADSAAHSLLPQFKRRGLQPFVRAVRTWRSAALRHLASLGVPAPPWLKGWSSLERYLSAMSWPVRASLLRARAVRDSIDGFIDPGDPPFLRGVVYGCRELRAGDEHRRLLGITAPKPLQRTHRGLVRMYSAARQGCRKASATARALLAAIGRYYKTGSDEDKAALERADKAAHTILLQFERGTLQLFFRAVGAWRSAALRYAASLGVPAPSWLKDLSVKA
jgi:hypothetical protein